MKVYIVIDDYDPEYGSFNIVKVFDSEDKANMFIAKMPYPDSYEVLDKDLE